jgi:hypothetical protein
MAIRYYPSTKIKTNQKALTGEFTLNGVVYSGYYYSTYDGKFFSGRNPIEGTNEELIPVLNRSNMEHTNISTLPSSDKGRTVISGIIAQQQSQPVSYHPKPLDEDYSRGYITRYFIKMVNQRGYVMEVSEQEYSSIKNGTAPYDISFIQTVDILWKLTGPLNNKRISQYDTRAGIIDTNKRLIETASKTFVGLKEFIGEEYAKFAKPTQ